MSKAQNTPVCFFLGSGGVGKSTVSALSAIDRAVKGKKVLIATFDPSPRLKDILISRGKFDNKKLNENLKVEVLNSKKIFEDLLEEVDLETSLSIKSNKLFKHLIERIQGVQEFSSLYFLSQHVGTTEYDLIIIDTPPLQNSLDFFSSPQKLKDLFESTIVKLFIGDFNKNWFERIFKKTRDIAFATLKKLTGIDFFEQLISLMKALEKLQPTILQTLESSQQLLASSDTSFAFVTTCEQQSLRNAEHQMGLLNAKGLEFRTLFINKFEVFSESDLSALIKEAKTSGKLKACAYLTYKLNVFNQRYNILSTLKSKPKLKIFTLPKFELNRMNEAELIKKSKDFLELS